MQGVIKKSTGSWYTVLYDDDQKEIQCRLRGKLKLSDFKTTNPVAVGDKVNFEINENDGTGSITEILDRENYVIRKAPKLSRQKHVIAANIDQTLLIVTLAEPRTSTGFIDRYLVTIEAYGIPACLIFNKYDIYDKEYLKTLEELTSIYDPLGYKCYAVSATQGTNLDQFRQLLSGKTSLLSGLSGTGKSTLINAIEPSLNLKTLPLSKAHKKGKHTTTFAEMFQLENNGKIIDTPGIKEFGLVDVEPGELSHFFPEMRKHLNECRFNDCLHIHEPHCKVKEEIEAGNIHYSRYLSYLSILEDVDSHR